MIRNIIKYGIYLLILIYVIKIINPTISSNIKNFLNTLLNSDENFIISNVSGLIKIIKKFFNIGKLKIFDNLFDDELKFNNKINLNDELKFNNKINLNNIFNDSTLNNSPDYNNLFDDKLIK
jgi:hypothetical protein